MVDEVDDNRHEAEWKKEHGEREKLCIMGKNMEVTLPYTHGDGKREKVALEGTDFVQAPTLIYLIFFVVGREKAALPFPFTIPSLLTIAAPLCHTTIPYMGSFGSPFLGKSNHLSPLAVRPL